MSQLHRKDDLISVEDYLAGETTSDIRHEYVDGYVYAMAGGKEAHGVIILNIAGQLNASAPEDCRVFASEMKIEFERAGQHRFYYPDVVVACGEHDNDRDRRSDPTLIVEVLSESTARTDRFEKFQTYTKIDSLQDYLIVEQAQPRVEHFRRANNWEREVRKPPSIISLESLGVTLSFEDIYRRLPEILALADRA